MDHAFWKHMYFEFQQQDGAFLSFLLKFWNQLCYFKGCYSQFSKHYWVIQVQNVSNKFLLIEILLMLVLNWSLKNWSCFLDIIRIMDYMEVWLFPAFFKLFPVSKSTGCFSQFLVKILKLGFILQGLVLSMFLKPLSQYYNAHAVAHACLISNKKLLFAVTKYCLESWSKCPVIRSIIWIIIQCAQW